MAYVSSWTYVDYDLADVDDRLAEILLSGDLTAWESATDQTKDILLTRAVEKLDSLAFVGSLYDEDQDELFPRVDADGDGYNYDPDSSEYVVPPAIFDAMCLEAVAILARQSDSLHEDLQVRGVKSVKISDVSYTYCSGGTSARGGFYSDRAWKLLERYLARDVCVI